MAWLQRMRGDIRDDEETEEASVGLMESEKPRNERKKNGSGFCTTHIVLVGLLIISNLFWVVVSIGLWTRSHSVHSIYATDFGEYSKKQPPSCRFKLTNALVVSANALPSQPVTIEFDDLLMWNSTSQEIYRAMDPSLPQYFGKPSPAIDAAWKKLMRYEYPAISQEEISRNPGLSFAPQDVHPLTRKHHFALDVFHNLHCLNAVRKELDKDYYGAHEHGHIGRADHASHKSHSAVDAAQRDHIDHCLNHIRQALQCRPDFSPAAMNVYTDTDGSGFFLGNAKRHSCYDWNSVMSWAKARESELGYVPMFAGGE